MRRRIVLFVLFNLLTVGYLVCRVWVLITLLFVDGSSDAISRAELPAPDSSAIGDRPQLIPKIIHQTYANESVPEQWRGAQDTCKKLHADYEYKFWTDKKAREFIAKEYPWFLETFDNYEFPIQRADSIRYFVLAHFGGIYIDLDDGCNRRLDPLLSYPAWVRRTIPTGISNDAMGAIPRHPFFMKVIDVLPDYSRSWVLPYITVMGTTGPLFLSVIWRHYNDGEAKRLSAGTVSGAAVSAPGAGSAAVVSSADDLRRVRVLFPDEYNNHPWSFFSHHKGNSWHGGDVRLIFWMSKHWFLLTVTGFIVGFGVLFALWSVYTGFLSTGRLKRRGAKRRKSLLPTRINSISNERERLVGAKISYELGDRLQA
jgi:mannosyltransferase OCH1-like enzyme